MADSVNALDARIEAAALGMVRRDSLGQIPHIGVLLEGERQEYIHRAKTALYAADVPALLDECERLRATLGRVEALAGELEASGIVCVYESALEIGEMIRSALDGGEERQP